MSKFQDSIAYRNRNPLNIRYSEKITWQGQDKSYKGTFVRFNRFSMGYRAAVKILRSYHLRDIRSIRDIVRTWAPPNENKTDQYIKNVVHFMNRMYECNEAPPEYCARTQINLRDKKEVVKLLLAMTETEMGANTAQILSMREYAELGFDMAVTAPGFYNGIEY